jgi:protein-S-isoprenylcysteine O-methyltransferase Ste14
LLALPLLPAFVWIITRRFILPEEARLRAAFGAEFDRWAARTPRWIGYRSISKGQ